MILMESTRLLKKKKKKNESTRILKNMKNIKNLTVKIYPELLYDTPIEETL